MARLAVCLHGAYAVVTVALHDQPLQVNEMRRPDVVRMSVATALLLVLIEQPADAYIDPGSASYLFQLLAGGALAALFLVRTYWNRLVTGLRSLISRDIARSG